MNWTDLVSDVGIVVGGLLAFVVLAFIIDAIFQR